MSTIIGKTVARVWDDAPCPLTGRVVGQIDADRLEVAWADEQFSHSPATSVEWFDELRPVRSDRDRCACGHAPESHWEIAEPEGSRTGCAILGCACTNTVE